MVCVFSFEYSLVASARANYFFLLPSRLCAHLTTLALMHIVSSKNPLVYKAWMLQTVIKMKDWNLLFFNGAPSNNSFINCYPRLKSLLSTRTRYCVLVDWERELFKGENRPTGGAAAETIGTHKNLIKKSTDGQLDFLSFHSLFCTYGHEHNMIHSCSSLLYPLLWNPCLNPLSLKSAADFSKLVLSTCHLRALVLFRLGAAPLSRNLMHETAVVDRICPFCYD